MSHLWSRAGFGALVLLLFAALPLPGVAQQSGGTLVILVQPEPPTLASYLSTSGPIGQVAPKIYEGLLEYDFELNPQPGLAKAWSVSDDGKTITFELQQGVTWHDGQPFTSADVQYSVMEVLSQVHPRGPNTFKEVQAVDTPDDHTAIFRLANPAPYLIRALSGYESPMLPKHLFEGTDVRDNPQANNPVGTGPFTFVEWRKGQYIRLDRNENYWRDGLPYLDRIVARFIPDAATRTAALESQEAHFAAFGAVPNIDVVRLRELDYIDVTTDGYSMINPMMLLELDTTQPPFDNKAVRQAVSHAIDRQFIIDNIWFGYGKPALAAYSSNFDAAGLFQVDQVKRYDGADRIEQAKALLDQAGYPEQDGKRFAVNHDIIPYGEEWRRLGEYLKQALGDIGIELTLRYEDVPTWLKRIYTDYDFSLNSNFFYHLPDPVLGMHRQYLSSQIRQGSVFVNSSRYNNPEIDDLLTRASVEVDPTQRGELYGQALTILSEDLPVIPLVEMQFTTLYNTKVKNAVSGPLGAYDNFANVWLEQ